MLIIASHNKGKIQEIQEILKPFSFNIKGLEEIGFQEEIIEDGESLEENALIKLRAIEKFLKEKKITASILSDDTGLFVEELKGKPGIHSARYGGEDGNDLLNRKRLLKELDKKENRKAYFETVLAFYDAEKEKEVLFTGRVDGEITQEEKGENGFGYDSIFYISEKEKTMAEMTDEEKNSISHRKRGLEELVQYLEENREDCHS